MKPSDVIRQLPPDWRVAFQSTAMRSSFCLSLTQPMLEFLCATADGVHWDRRLYSQQLGVARPDSWISSSAALMKRGLVRRLDHPRILKNEEGLTFEETVMFVAHYELTPAGTALVELLKVTGIFAEADAAIVKKLRKGAP